MASKSPLASRINVGNQRKLFSHATRTGRDSATVRPSSRWVCTIIQRFECKGLRLVGLKVVHAGQKLAAEHYAVHKNRPFYKSLLTFLTSGPTVALVLEGREAVAVVRGLMGPTDGTKASPGTIR